MRPIDDRPGLPLNEMRRRDLALQRVAERFQARSRRALVVVWVAAGVSVAMAAWVLARGAF